MHEFTRRFKGSRDPDKTNPPTRVEDLWGWKPGRKVDSWPEEASDAGPRPDSPVALADNDAISLYWAARDCMIAGAYAGATGLLRRLIVNMTEEKALEAGTRVEAERLFACAEELLGRPHENPSELSRPDEKQDGDGAPLDDDARTASPPEPSLSGPQRGESR